MLIKIQTMFAHANLKHDISTLSIGSCILLWLWNPDITLVLNKRACAKIYYN